MCTTIWTLETAKKEHLHSRRLAEGLAKVLPSTEPVLDLGCGRGFYLDYLARRGFHCLGVEGTPGISEIALFPDIIQADLSRPLDLKWPPSSVLCIEVAEHLLSDQEAQLLDNIHRYCSGWLVISWAVPGQAGTGHHNCRPNSYVYKQLASRGFELLPLATFELRELAGIDHGFFRNTLLAFCRRCRETDSNV